MLYIMDACTVAPLFRGADGPNCKDIINGIAFSMPSCLCHMDDTAIFLVFYKNTQIQYSICGKMISGCSIKVLFICLFISCCLLRMFIMFLLMKNSNWTGPSKFRLLPTLSKWVVMFNNY